MTKKNSYWWGWCRKNCSLWRINGEKSGPKLWFDIKTRRISGNLVSISSLVLCTPSKTTFGRLTSTFQRKSSNEKSQFLRTAQYETSNWIIRQRWIWWLLTGKRVLPFWICWRRRPWHRLIVLSRKGDRRINWAKVQFLSRNFRWLRLLSTPSSHNCNRILKVLSEGPITLILES